MDSRKPNPKTNNYGASILDKLKEGTPEIQHRNVGRPFGNSYIRQDSSTFDQKFRLNQCGKQIVFFASLLPKD